MARRLAQSGYSVLVVNPFYRTKKAPTAGAGAYTKTNFGRDDNSFIAIARLRPGVSVAQARAEMEGIRNRVRRQYPKEDANMGATVMPLANEGIQGLPHDDAGSGLLFHAFSWMPCTCRGARWIRSQWTGAYSHLPFSFA